MRAALADAGLHRADYVNAHGTGTAANDVTEAAATVCVLGEDPSIGKLHEIHAWTRARRGRWALEAIATILTLRERCDPPDSELHRTRDPECDLDVVPNEPRCAEVETALSNSFAFGGLNAVLAFRR